MDSTLQSRLHLWRMKNFPSTDDVQQLLGVSEEVGELCHHVLKQKQGIRGSDEFHDSEIVDAVGDIQIFLSGFCSLRGIDMQAAYEETAKEVMKRDWVGDPDTGGTGQAVGTRLRNSPDGDPNYPRLDN